MRDPRSVQMAETVAVNGKEPPYEPSWVDRFNSWAETVPVNVWIFYTVLGIVLILFQIFFRSRSPDDADFLSRKFAYAQLFSLLYGKKQNI